MFRPRAQSATKDTTYPREGTETDRGPTPPRRTYRPHLSPRGDGNLADAAAPEVAVDTTYPREGTETAQTVISNSGIHMTQLIPARGRKLIEAERGYEEATRHNLSPRGDGNLTRDPDTVIRRRTQLIPARGRKLLVLTLTFLCVATQLIPARGRKLTSALLFCLCCRT